MAFLLLFCLFISTAALNCHTCCEAFLSFFKFFLTSRNILKAFITCFYLSIKLHRILQVKLILNFCYLVNRIKKIFHKIENFYIYRLLSEIYYKLFPYLPLPSNYQRLVVSYQTVTVFGFVLIETFFLVYFIFKLTYSRY